MDMFFAGVELLRYPELRGVAMVVGGRSAHAPQTLADGSRSFYRLRDYVGRGVVTTSTYEARAQGVFSGMGMMKVAQLAPNAVLLPADFEAYRYYSRLFKQAVATVAPKIEDRGIDEIYIDLTDHPEANHALAQHIKQAVFDATRLSCSICIAPNKLLAKIGSDLDKPDGLTLLDEASIATRIWPLKVGKVNGIGPKAAEKLATLGIATIAELAHADPALLQMHFGLSSAAWLLAVAHGHDERPVVTRSEPKSASRETTFERDLHARRDRATLSAAFTALCERVAGDLQHMGYAGRSIGIKIKYQDFKTVTRDLTLPVPTCDAATIRRAAGECLKRVALDRKIRLLGVRVGGLVHEAPAGTEGKMPVQRVLSFETEV
jgi:DNA polymerase-4